MVQSPDHCFHNLARGRTHRTDENQLRWEQVGYSQRIQIRIRCLHRYTYLVDTRLLARLTSRNCRTVFELPSEAGVLGAGAGADNRVQSINSTSVETLQEHELPHPHSWDRLPACRFRGLEAYATVIAEPRFVTLTRH